MKDFLQALVYGGAFLVLFIPLLVSDTMFFPYITGKNFSFRILVEVLFGAWVLLALLDVQYRPRFSWILAGSSALMVVMLFANFNGEYPLKSFWSNFERMDGYMMLLHFYLYFVVLAHILRTQKMWSYFLHTSLVVASFVAMQGISQSLGDAAGRRVDSTLGNAAYMAVYMLFHIFFLAFLMLRSKGWFLRSLYIVGTVMFIYVLLKTGTRGTFIGLVGGSVVSASYIALFSRRYPQLRKVAIGGLGALIVLAGTFFVIKDSSVIQENAPLSRIANISSHDLTVRATIWGMAVEGFKERPLLGWGQGNFNYVFNTQYDPSLHSQESWFDRVHNIFFDWLIAGGVLGLTAYLSIFVSCVYYLFWRPMFRKSEDEDVFSVPERAILLGLLAGYFAHNLVVFDNLVSYTFFAVVLAILHSRVGVSMPKVESFRIDKKVVTSVCAPVVGVMVIATIYFANIPGLQAAGDIIDAFRTSDITERFEKFELALDRNSFATQEIVEQLSQQAIRLSSQTEVSAEVKEGYLDTAEKHINDLIEQKPGDARLHVFLSSFYRSTGEIQLAADQAQRAHELSPEKQAIIMEQGVIELQRQNFAEAEAFLKKAYDLAPEFIKARELYAVSLIFSNKVAVLDSVISEEEFQTLAFNNTALQAAEQGQHTALLLRMLETRVAVEPSNPQHRASLAFLHYRSGDLVNTRSVIETGIADIPEFRATGGCYIKNIDEGKAPTEGCE